MVLINRVANYFPEITVALSVGILVYFMYRIIKGSIPYDVTRETISHRTFENSRNGGKLQVDESLLQEFKR
jgi:hypothetical protein